MGRLHSRIYSQMDEVSLVAIVDQDIEKSRELTGQFGGEALTDPAGLNGKVDAVTVAVPTECHEAIASPLLKQGVAVLVEKPIADSREKGQRMLELAKANNCILQVGYSERFNPVSQAMNRLGVKPRFIESNRISPFTFRSTDVGVVLDMMIHDIDIILSLAKSPVIDVHAVGVNVLGAHEDIANVRLIFENGCVANMMASRLALKTERRIRLFSEDAYLSLDLFKKTGTMISKSANINMLQELRKVIGEDGQLNLFGTDWSKLVHVEELNIDDKEPLRLEQEAFIKAVMEGGRPEVSAEDAIAAMELAERIVDCIGKHEWEGSSAAHISQTHWHGSK